MLTTTPHALDSLNSLLRGELAALETYEQALVKIGNDFGVEQLRHIYQQHRDAANHLRLQVRRLAGTADDDSGAWGAFAAAVEGTAKLFGNAAALKALKEGEEHGVESYRDALQDEALPAECRNLIIAMLLPQTEAHVSVLDRLIDAQ